MAYTDSTIIINRLGVERAKRLFDRDGDDTLDAGVLALGISHAEALIHAMLSAAFGTARFDANGPTPDHIVSIATDLVIGHAAQAFPGASAEANQPYALMYKNAKDLLSSLARDRQARLPASVGGAALPNRNAESYVESADTTPTVWNDKSGF